MTKITGAQSPMVTKKYTKFEKDSLKGSREKQLLAVFPHFEYYNTNKS